MKQLTIRAAVGSALLVLSGLASANNINFTSAADAVIDAELAPLIASFQMEYGENLQNFPKYVAESISGYTTTGYYYVDDDYLKRAVALSELSNSEVSFTNTSDLGIYKETITPHIYNDPSYGYTYTYSQLASFGQNGFTADFSKPVTSVSMDFALTDYYGYIYPGDWATGSPYSHTITSSTPAIVNATYKDALGNVIGNSSTSYNYGVGLNNTGFSLDSSNPFSTVDFSWDVGTVTILALGGKYETGFEPYERTYGNLLTANNFTYTEAVAVPEPETYAMMMAGLGMLGFTARRKKANHLLSKRS